MFLQQLFTGLSIGSIYALMAVGYSLIYSLLNFTNFAHAVVVTAGAYLGFFALSMISPNPLFACMIAIVFGGLLSVIIEIIAYRPLLLKNVKRLYLLIAGLGLQTIGENLIIVKIGGRFKAYPPIFSQEPVKIFGANIGVVDLQILFISFIVLLIVEGVIRYTRNGLAIRGAAFSLDATSIMGVDVDRLIMIVFLVAGALAGLAGYFLGIKYTAYPQLGGLTVKAFISAVFGGLGSIPGAVVGALLLGVTETMVSGYISSSMRDVFSFTLLVIILLVRPSGLMGKITEDKA